MSIFLAFNHQNITVIIALFLLLLLLRFPLCPPNSLTGGSRWTRTTDPCLIKAVL